MKNLLKKFKIDRLEIRTNLSKFSFLFLGLIFISLVSCTEEDDYNSLLKITKITDIKQLTAKCEVTIQPEEDLIVFKRGVCWNRYENPTINENFIQNGEGFGSFTIQLSGLLMGSTYYIRAYALTNKGIIYSQSSSFNTIGYYFTDPREKRPYKIITIGNQIWFGENLKYLPRVNSSNTLSVDNACYYVNGYHGQSLDSARRTLNYHTYGVLYNYKAALSACPVGWHLPSAEEWDELADSLGGRDIAGGKLKEMGYEHWSYPNVGATNSSGFTALPGGSNSEFGFSFINTLGQWWSSSEYNATLAEYQWLFYEYERLHNSSVNKKTGCSVRCIKD